MPHAMPALAGSFLKSIGKSSGLVLAGESARVLLTAPGTQRINLARLEMLYEMAFLRVFLAWETFLEESFIRYMTGYAHRMGTEPVPAGTSYYTTISAAKAAILGGQ